MSQAPNPFGTAARVAVGYALLFWASVLWFGVFSPDWMLSYMIPSAQINSFFAQPVFLISLILSALSGQVLTSVFLQRNRTFGIQIAFFG